MIKVFLKGGRDKPVRMGHPWIFNGAISRVEGNGVPGSLCHVLTAGGEFVGTGYFNSNSAITIRMVSRKKEFNESDIAERIQRSVEARKNLLDLKTDSCRLVNSEGDFIPGLIVDKCGQGLVIQILTAGMESYRKKIVDILAKTVLPEFIYERSDTESRKRECLEEREGILFGNLPRTINVIENGLRFNVDVKAGQKTGFFFDQRPNRELLTKYAAGRNVCDCFSYSGGFTVYALSAGASFVRAVDISKAAVQQCELNSKLNGFDNDKAEFIAADVFKYLRVVDTNYDMIVLDPPKFAKHPGEVPRAARGYKDINLLALKNLRSGGMLFTFSCSNAVDPKLFRQIIFSAAADADRQVQLLHVLSAGPDHPVNIAHKEGEYLKGLVLKVI